MKINISTSAVVQSLLASLIVGSFVFGWNLNGRLSRLEAQQNIVQRVENLENMLQPVLIQFEVEKRLKELRIKEEPKTIIEYIKEPFLPEISKTEIEKIEAEIEKSVEAKFDSFEQK